MSSSIVFFISLVALFSMLVEKWVSVRSGRQGLLSVFLSRFDAPLGKLITNLSLLLRVGLIALIRYTLSFFKTLHHLFAAYIHQLITNAERRVRMWREFAREQKIERKSASLFIQDVVEYKTQLKERHGHS